MKFIKGDLIELAKAGVFDVIVHGNNCYCNMGKGIARSIKKAFPEAYRADMATVKGDKSKLGTYSQALITTYHLRVINAYTQFNFWDQGDLFDYEAFEKILQALQKDFPHAKIGFPRIGAGNAQGNLSKIITLIDTYLPLATMVEYDGPV